jgi:hypothetical protein
MSLVQEGQKVQRYTVTATATVCVCTRREPCFQGVHRAYNMQMADAACGLMHAPVNASAAGAALS